MGYTVQIGGRFNATHRLRLPDGTAEPLHGHDWRVRCVFGRADGGLDACGFVADFHVLERRLRDVTDAWQHGHLNDAAAFAGTNPSAEAVASCVARTLRVPDGVRLVRVEVEESPGCVACWEPDA